jgi:beta-lactamase class C
MKKPGLIASVIIILFALFVSGKKNGNSENEVNLNNDSIAIEPIPTPLDIAELIYDYDSILTAGFKTTNTVGAAVAIVYKNQVAFLKCHGVKKARTNDSINENTIFRLASVSKPVSGVLAGMLADEKIINFDDKVTDYIPELRLKSESYTRELTIKNLLSHTTGLVPHAYDDLVEQKVPLEKIMDRLYLANTSSSPGRLYTYQNVMFSLIDPIVEKQTGKNYGDVLKEKVFIPFGMNNASTGFDSFMNNENKALPHSGRTPIRMNDRYYNTTPAAGINASISDMSNFLLTILKDSVHAISENVEEEIFTPQINTVLSRGYFRQWDRVNSKAYGIGWRIIDYKGRKVAYHGGYLQGYRAEIALCKDEQVGIVYLSNSPSAVAAKSVPEFFNRLFEFKDFQKLANASTEKDLITD